MEKPSLPKQPNRIIDLVRLKQSRATVTINTEFDVIPVDFKHRDNSFRAYIFLCQFSGKIDETDYYFRKCYARGCPHNLCPHVSQAVMVANRYLQRDFRTLKQGGIKLEERLFSLDDMTVKFEGYEEEHGPLMTIDDYINIAKEGADVTAEITLEFVPAVEHFARHKNSQTFLQCIFTLTSLGKTYQYQACFSCFPTAEQDGKKQESIRVANERLTELYQRLDDASVRFEKRFFD